MALSESQISNQVKGFMEAHGWRALRNTRMIAPGRFQTGEPGMPDYLFLRYSPIQTLWIEFKRPEDRRKCACLKNAGTRKRCTVCDQKAWKDREKLRGAMVWTVKDYDAFVTLYGDRFTSRNECK